MSNRLTKICATGAVAALLIGGAALPAQASEPKRVDIATVSPTPAPPSAEKLRSIGRLMPSQAKFKENKNLDRAGAQKRLEQVQKKYTKVGEVLAPADAEFVRLAGAFTPEMKAAEGAENSAPSITTSALIVRAATQGINKTCKLGTASGTVSGSHTMNYNGVISGSWSTSFKATGSTAVNKVRAAEHIRMYGLVGSSGIGVVYAADPSSTISGRTNTFARNASFTALAAYFTMQFYTPSSSFSCAG